MRAPERARPDPRWIQVESTAHLRYFGPSRPCGRLPHRLDADPLRVGITVLDEATLAVPNKTACSASRTRADGPAAMSAERGAATGGAG